MGLHGWCFVLVPARGEIPVNVTSDQTANTDNNNVVVIAKVTDTSVGIKQQSMKVWFACSEVFCRGTWRQALPSVRSGGGLWAESPIPAAWWPRVPPNTSPEIGLSIVLTQKGAHASVLPCDGAISDARTSPDPPATRASSAARTRSRGPAHGCSRRPRQTCTWWWRQAVTLAPPCAGEPTGSWKLCRAVLVGSGDRAQAGAPPTCCQAHPPSW